MADGGYYAIKGFEFQIDKTILLILDSEDHTPVFLEQIQDINTDGYVIQVKYKETQDYIPSKIKDPIIQLISEYQKDSSKIYYLYCYFKDTQEVIKTLTTEELDSILGNKKGNFDATLKRGFVSSFKLQFSKSFQEQFEKVIIEIQTLAICSDFDEALIHYGCITNHLRKIVVMNTNIGCRTCTKKELLKLISRNRKTIFDSAYRTYKGDEKYFLFIKKQHFTFRNIDNWERFFIIELLGNENISSIKSVVLNIKDKFYKKHMRAIKSGAPYIFLKGISMETLKTLKRELISDGNVVKDGYDFKDADFNFNSITEKKL
ncbi:hypothetical protein [Desulfosporosinus nitroreducens]|uniref:Uncharacterized protein n=1 Tax=Desulfosporosinus nitroreducens TaxID=2018668 RepID=A0ABT8QRU7_9FIRM|nr:hypothetical protein [Desulfosporosinus nitroreducens]MDO0823319.1 hypothetical protein [Desulfosporosinus nitroreducens]